MITLTTYFKAIEIGGGSVVLHVYPIFFIVVLITIRITTKRMFDNTGKINIKTFYLKLKYEYASNHVDKVTTLFYASSYLVIEIFL